MLYLGALFLVKVLDNALSTTKTILIQRSRWVLAGIAVILSDFLYFWITKRIVSADSMLALTVVAAAGGVGCSLACLVSDKRSKDRTYVNVILSDNLEAMQAVCGPARELRLYGGGSKSDLWCQIIADVTNIPVARLVSSETALAGAAMLAYHPLGVQTSASLSCAQRFAPDAQQAAAYQAAYEHYESIRQKYFSE